jgi:hypothetical protein
MIDLWIFKLVQSRKYNDEKAWIENGRKEFEQAWQSDPSTHNRPINFPSNSEEIAEMTTWLREAIQTHQLASDVSFVTDLANLSVQASQHCLIKKPKHMSTISELNMEAPICW